MYITLIILVVVVGVAHVSAVFSSEFRCRLYSAGQCRVSDNLKLLTLTPCPPVPFVMKSPSRSRSRSQSPPKFVHSCPVKGCGRSYAFRDKHSACYLHRECELTRAEPVSGARPCDVCRMWTPDDFKSFAVRLSRRQRQSPACGKKSTASLPTQREKISFTVSKKSTNVLSVSSSQVDAGSKKKKSTPPVPQPQTPARTYAQAASPAQTAIYVAPGGQVMKGSSKVTPLRPSDRVSSAVQQSRGPIPDRDPAYGIVFDPSFRPTWTPPRSPSGFASGAQSPVERRSPGKPRPVVTSSHSSVNSSTLGSAQSTSTSIPSLTATSLSTSTSTTTSTRPVSRSTLDAPPQVSTPPPSAVESKLDAIMAMFSTFKQSSSARMDSLESALLAQARPAEVREKVSTVAAPSAPSASQRVDAPSTHAKVDAFSSIGNPKRRRVDATTDTEIRQSDASMQTDEESMDDSPSSSGEESVHSVSDDEQSQSPSRQLHLPSGGSPGLDNVVQAGLIAHQRELTHDPDPNYIQRLVSEEVSRLLAQSASTSVKDPQVTFQPPPGVTRAVPPTAQEVPKEKPYKIPRKERSPHRSPHRVLAEPPRPLPKVPRPKPVPAPEQSVGRQSRSRTRQSPRAPQAPPVVSAEVEQVVINATPPPPQSQQQPSSKKRSRSSPVARQTSVETSRRSKSVSDSEYEADPDREPDESDARPFRQAIRNLISALPGISQASDPGPLRYPEGMASLQTGRAKDKPVFLPPHASLKQWYDFVEQSLVDTSAKRGTAFVSPSIRRTASLYNTGKEGDFLLSTRSAPDNFKELSNFQQQDQVKKQLNNAVSLSSGIFKAVDKNVRVGLGASSYASHFLDGAETTLSALQEKVEKLAAPAASSAASHKAVDDQRDAMLPLLEQAMSFVERAKTASFDSVGSLALVDVNLTLAQRDKLVTRLRPYLVHHTAKLRHASCMSKDLLPNVAEISTLARDDATQESTRQLATHLGEVTKGRKPQQQYQNKGKSGDNRGKGAQDGRQPFQSRPQQNAKGADDRQYGGANKGGNPRPRKRKRSKQNKSK